MNSVIIFPIFFDNLLIFAISFQSIIGDCFPCLFLEKVGAFWHHF